MYQNELYHHGVKGQQWGIRRYQNADGSLTSQGRQRIQSRVTMLDGKKSRLEEKKSKIDSKISNGSRLSIKKSKWDKKAAVAERKYKKREKTYVTFGIGKRRVEKALKKYNKYKIKALRYDAKDSKMDNKSAKLARKIDKVRQKIEKNNELLNLKMSDITKNFGMQSLNNQIANQIRSDQIMSARDINSAMNTQNIMLDTHMMNLHNSFM